MKKCSNTLHFLPWLPLVTQVLISVHTANESSWKRALGNKTGHDSYLFHAQGDPMQQNGLCTNKKQKISVEKDANAK